jgi:hypothetical protein
VATELLNSFYSFPGSWNPNLPTIVSMENSLTITPQRTVRFHSTGVSGGVTLVNNSPGGPPIAANGVPEVWLRITDINNLYRYLSAPLSTAIDFPNVSEIVLGVSVIVANSACTDVTYNLLVNAHLIYELL